MPLLKKKNENEMKKKQEKVNVCSRLKEEIEEICPRCIGDLYTVTSAKPAAYLSQTVRKIYKERGFVITWNQ